jgi:hypothetical protein
MTTAKEEVKRPPQDLIQSRVGFLLPVASDEDLVDGFKRYVALKEKLLEETDYVWYAVYRVGEKLDRKGFQTRPEAETLITTLRSRGAVADLEKRVRKSGCLKLGKAFGISTEILWEKLDRDRGYAEYRMKATAANGQFKEKTGSCDRGEKSKAQAPFDTIMATACTRAEDRAIMSLLGGETTAEEMSEEEVASQVRPDPVKAPDPVPARADAPVKPSNEKPRPTLASEAQERLKEISEKFGGTQAAKPVDKRTLIGWMFAAAKKAKLSNEELKRGIGNKYKVESTKDMTEAQLIELTRILEEMAADKDAKF